MITPGSWAPELILVIALSGACMVVCCLSAVGRALEAVDRHEVQRRKLLRRRSDEPLRF